MWRRQANFSIGGAGRPRAAAAAAAAAIGFPEAEPGAEPPFDGARAGRAAGTKQGCWEYYVGMCVHVYQCIGGKGVGRKRVGRERDGGASGLVCTVFVCACVSVCVYRIGCLIYTHRDT